MRKAPLAAGKKYLTNGGTCGIMYSYYSAKFRFFGNLNQKLGWKLQKMGRNFVKAAQNFELQRKKFL